MSTLFVGIVPAVVAYVACFACGAAFPAQVEEEGSIIQDWQKKGLLAALNDPSAEVLKRTILFSVANEQIAAILRALAETPMNQASRIAELLKDKDRYVRRAAVEALGSLGAKEQALAIVERLKDQWSYVRRAAVEALANLGAKEQLSAIVERLKDEDSDVRRAAVEALASLGAKVQAPAIVERLKDEDSAVRRAAVEPLGSLGTKEEALAMAEWLKDQHSGVRRSAVQALGSLRATEQAPAIAGRLKDEDPYVREAAVQVLASLGAKEQAPAIVERLKDQWSYVRRAAVEALANLGAKEQAPAIAEQLKDGDFGVRETALEALVSLGAKEQAPAIAERLKDEDSDVRRAVVEALASLGAKEQSPAIAERLKDEDSDVRKAAVEALVKLGPLGLGPILHVLGNSYRQPDEAGHVLFLAHFLGGGERTNELVISWLGRRPANIEIPVDQLTAKPHEARATLEAFKEAWDMSKDLPQLRKDLAQSIAVVVKEVSWEASALPLLKEHEQDLREGGFPEVEHGSTGGCRSRNHEPYRDSRRNLVRSCPFLVVPAPAVSQVPASAGDLLLEPLGAAFVGLGLRGIFAYVGPPAASDPLGSLQGVARRRCQPRGVRSEDVFRRLAG